LPCVVLITGKGYSVDLSISKGVSRLVWAVVDVLDLAVL
jgi:hypothetical protein